MVQPPMGDGRARLRARSPRWCPATLLYTSVVVDVDVVVVADADAAAAVVVVANVVSCC